MGIVEQYLLQLNKEKRRFVRSAAVLTAMSVFVAIGVSWNLRITAVTIANEASCGYTEHQHSEACIGQPLLVCQIEEADPTAAQPAEQPTQPAEQPTEPAEQPTQPAEQPTEPAEQPAEVAETAQQTDGQTQGQPEEQSPPQQTEQSSEPTETTGQNTTPHTHGDGCYLPQYICAYEEHIHSISCYTDTKADVESKQDWEDMFADYPYSGNLRTDLVGIAKTQVGYTESVFNFYAEEGGLRHGYTRYGQWYGAPYNDWSAMFVSFCLNYAKADMEKYPASSGADTMAGQWKELGRYATAGERNPVSGDLVFFTDNTVGVVAEVQHTTIHVIAGDVDNAVCTRAIPLTDPSIEGWGIIYTTSELLSALEDQNQPDSDIPAVEVTPTTPADNLTSGDLPTEDPLAGAVTEPTASPTPTASPDLTGTPTDTTPPSTELLPEGETTEGLPEGETTEGLPTGETTEGDINGETTQPLPEQSGEQTEPVTSISPELLDITNGPAVFIFEDGQYRPRMRLFAMRSSGEIFDLLDYLAEYNGSYFFTLLDTKNVEVPKDADGNYIVQPNTDYKLSISFYSPDGFQAETYQYQTPNGLMVNGGQGEFILKDLTNVGSWTVTDTGLITMEFNEEITSRSQITISVALGINFAPQDEPIDFDGKITVTVEPPPPQQYPTGLLKWGQQGSGDKDASKIYWTVQITGNRDSQIPGNILTDQTVDGEWSKTHSYTESDIAGGLTFGISEPDPVTGQFKDWHSFHVDPDDPHLIWDENGWSYKMPTTITCQWCGEVELGNANWIYTVNYTSTPDRVGAAGTYGYENKVTIDGQTAYSWADFVHGETHAEISKYGTFVADAGSGNFVWEIKAIIPGVPAGQPADYSWYLMDYMYLMNSDGVHEKPLHNDADKSMVTATINGTTVRVPSVESATPADEFAWHNAWTAQQYGVSHGQEIFLLHRCHCTAQNCRYWNNGCEQYGYKDENGQWAANGFCLCWTEENEVIFTVVYNTSAVDISETYGGFGYRVHNIAELHSVPPGSTAAVKVKDDDATADIPNLFKKELTQDFNGYTAHYVITVNEAKAVLTDGSPLIIQDTMTDTLAYISGSLVITTEDANGNTSKLQQDLHYTVEYDGKENEDKVHNLYITILRPRPVKYILEYDTTLIMPDQVTAGIKYTNSATVTLWDKPINADTPQKTYAEFVISAENYTIQLLKLCAVTAKPLQGAEFGLYNENGGLIDKSTTNRNGLLEFKTNTAKGIILRDHQLYYMQETAPPPTYLLDKQKYYFVYCNSTADSCETCNKVIGDKNAVRIPDNETACITALNHPADYELPGTGGIGTILHMICGLILVSAPLAYGLSLRRRHERRSRE